MNHSPKVRNLCLCYVAIVGVAFGNNGIWFYGHGHETHDNPLTDPWADPARACDTRCSRDLDGVSDCIVTLVGHSVPFRWNGRTQCCNVSCSQNLIGCIVTLAGNSPSHLLQPCSACLRPVCTKAPVNPCNAPSVLSIPSWPRDSPFISGLETEVGGPCRNGL